MTGGSRAREWGQSKKKGCKQRIESTATKKAFSEKEIQTALAQFLLLLLPMHLRFHAHFVEFVALAEALHAVFHQKQGHSVGPLGRISLGAHHYHVAQPAVGDEHLSQTRKLMHARGEIAQK